MNATVEDSLSLAQLSVSKGDIFSMSIFFFPGNFQFSSRASILLPGLGVSLRLKERKCDPGHRVLLGAQS